MTRNTDPMPENLSAWNEQNAAGLVHWLRAGGQLGEWADHTLEDIQFASLVLDLDEGSTVLNLGCGWGRHAIALAHYGLNVIGLDSSNSLLAFARETCEQLNIPVRWVHGDLGDLALTEPVDAVVQFNGNILEWAETPAEALFILDQIHALLKPAGHFLFGSPDWKASPPRHEKSRADTPRSTELYSHIFDPDSRTMHSQTVVIERDGSQRMYQRRSWHPSAEQMADLLYQANFDIEGQLNAFNYLPYDPSRPGLVWLARRR
jgi:cyclopropane fatty-acyl-phospholipid synthase-like methyltransferase